ncbi:MAG: IPExxxVDY family protein [Bacteroidota bacterium]
MVKKRQILKLGLDNDTSLIGISCHLKSYRLSFAMDTSLGLAFQRIADFEIPGQVEEILNYPFLIYEDDDLKNQFCLVGNHHPQGKLVPALRQVDFFLMAKNPIEQLMLGGIIQKIRKIPQVLAAYEIDTAGTKDIDILLGEMELHLMVEGKNQTH